MKSQPGHVTILPAVRQEKMTNVTPSPRKFPPIVIQNADGTQTHIVATVPNDKMSVSTVTNSDVQPLTVIMAGSTEGQYLIVEIWLLGMAVYRRHWIIQSDVLQFSVQHGCIMDSVFPDFTNENNS